MAGASDPKAALVERPPRPPGEVVVAWLVAGAIAGAAAGAIDGLWSWRRAEQFLPGVGGRIRWLAYLAASHALAGAAVGAAAGALGLVWSRVTRLGATVRAPRDRVVALSLAIAVVPCLAIAIYAVHAGITPKLTDRKHAGLVIASAMAAAIAAVVAAIVIAYLIARPIEIGLRAVSARRPRIARAIDRPRAAPIAFAVLAGAVAAIAIHAQWKTVDQLKLRPVAVAALGAVLVIGALAPGVAIGRRLRVWWRRATALAGGAIVAFVAMLLAGGDPAVIKASSSHTGLGGPIARVVRVAFDWDRDGFARVLGGGDCDDGDPAIHPGAPEIPDDGIDQNCIGGDPTLTRSIDELAFAPVPPSVPPGFNVLLLTIDTLRSDHVSSYGYPRPTSPAIDAIAAGGTRFANAWAHAPSTRYSMPAILTGRLPLEVRYDTTTDGWPGLAPDATTIAEALKPLGFTTGAITNYWYFDEVRRMNQGFDEYDNTNKRLHSGVAGQGPAHTRGSSSREQTDKALAFVTRHADTRWFLWVHYYDPHYEYERHADVPGFGTDREALYDGEIRFTDHHVARLVDDLKARGLYDRTAIVVTGDHGEGFGEHGIDLHGYHLYAAQTRVPIIVRVPGLAPRVSATPVGHVDILPTLVNLAGGTPDLAMMGRSMVDIVAGAPDRDRPVFQQLSYEGNHEMRGVATQRCHVIYNVSPDTSWEAYRVDIDPDEARDVGTSSGPCLDARRALEKWYDASEVPAGAADALLATAPQVARPLGVRFGDEVELVAVDVAAQARPGDLVPVTWTFLAHGPLTGGWKVFVHFEDGRGARFTNDHAPVRPFEWWRSGQYIRYTTTATVPKNIAPGRYTVWAGLWKGNLRRPARTGATAVRIVDNRADVAALEVVR